MYAFIRSRIFAGTVAFVAWGALVLQYALLIGATWGDIGALLGTLRFFSFFTILSNLLVALVATSAWIDRDPGARAFLHRPRVRGAAALCVSLTCGIYFFVLAATWSPHGAQLLADVGLHYAVPALYVVWWTGAVPHGRLVWTDALRWLAIPALFLGWTLLRGALLHEYPYPFVNVGALGLVAVLRNALGIGLLFVLAGLALVAFDRNAGAKT